MSIQSIPPAALGSALQAAAGRGAETPAPQATAPSAAPVAADGQDAGASGSAADIAEALETVRTALEPVARNLQFSVDDDTGKTVVRIIDSSTNEVIKQFPSEEILAIARSIDKLQGLLLRQEA